MSKVDWGTLWFCSVTVAYFIGIRIGHRLGVSSEKYDEAWRQAKANAQWALSTQHDIAKGEK